MLPAPVESRVAGDLRDLQDQMISWRQHATEFSWSQVFGPAQRINYAQINNALTAEAPYETVAVTKVEQGMSGLKSAVMGVFVLAAILITSDVMVSVIESSAADAVAAERIADLVSSVTTFLGLLLGGATLLMLAWSSALVMFAAPAGHGQSPHRRTTAKVVNLVVPAPITFTADTELGPEGELVAKVWRTVPVFADGKLTVRCEQLGSWAFSDGDDTADAVARWERILDELERLDELAAGPYRAVLEQEGLTEDQRLDTEAQLRARVGDAQDRKLLNARAVDTLNEHTAARAQLVD